MLADIILKIAEDENREKGEHEYYARPSIAGPQRCIRQMVYWGLKTAKKPLPGRAVMKFSDSSFHEDLTADWIRKTAYKLHSEQMHVNIPSTLTFLPERICKFKIAGKECGQVIPAGHIAGHTDGILTDLIEQDTLWEHKAISHFSFGMFEKAEELPLDNITQTVIYLKGLQLIQPEMRQGLLLIKNKNTAQYLEYLISYDSKKDLTFVHNLISSTEGQKEINKELVGLTQQAFDKFALVQEHITSKTIPARQYDRND